MPAPEMSVCIWSEVSIHGLMRLVLQAIAEHLQEQPELFPGLLNTLFEITLFQECANQWSLSRPMLTLILVNEQIYPQMQERIIQSRPASRQSTLRACLSKLMDDVQRNLDPKNRDKFTQVTTDALNPSLMLASGLNLFCFLATPPSVLQTLLHFLQITVPPL